MALLSTAIVVPVPAEAAPAWEYLDEMPFELTRFCSAQLPDGRMFVAMGSSNTFDGDTWIYDPVDDEWFEGANAPSGWWFSSAAAMPDGTVYVFGGYVPGMPGEYNDKVLIYETATDSWRTGPTNPQTTYMGGAAVLDDRRILLIGGYYEDILSSCIIFDTVSERFLPAAELPRPRAAGSVVVGDDSVYYIGGIENSPLNEEEVYRYDITMGTWNLQGTMAEACSAEAAALGADGMVYLQGGSQGLFNNINSPARARALDLGDMSLHELPAPPEKGTYGGLLVSDGRLVIFGGSDGGEMNTDVLSLPLYESSAELGATSAEPGTSVRVNVSVELYFVDDISITAIAHLMKGGVSYGSCSLSTPSGGFATGLLSIPDDALPGEYEVVITDTYLGVGVECTMEFEAMDLSVTDSPSPTEQLDEMQEQLDALQEELDAANADLKDALDAKLDTVIGYVILALVLITLVVAVIVLVRKK